MTVLPEVGAGGRSPQRLRKATAIEGKVRWNKQCDLRSDYRVQAANKKG